MIFEDLFSRILFLIFREDLFSRIAEPQIFREDLISRTLPIRENKSSRKLILAKINPNKVVRDIVNKQFTTQHFLSFLSLTFQKTSETRNGIIFTHFQNEKHFNIKFQNWSPFYFASLQFQVLNIPSCKKKKKKK